MRSKSKRNWPLFGDKFVLAFGIILFCNNIVVQADANQNLKLFCQYCKTGLGIGLNKQTKLQNSAQLSLCSEWLSWSIDIDFV